MFDMREGVQKLLTGEAHRGTVETDMNEVTIHYILVAAAACKP